VGRAPGEVSWLDVARGERRAAPVALTFPGSVPQAVTASAASGNAAAVSNAAKLPMARMADHTSAVTGTVWLGGRAG